MTGALADSDLPRARGPVRLFEAVPLPVPAVALLLLGTYLAVGTVLYVVTGYLGASSGLTPNILFAEAVNGLIITYLLFAEQQGRRGLVRDLEALRPELRCSDGAFQALLSRALLESRTIYFVGMLVALGFAIVIVEFDPALWEGWSTPLDPLFLWAVVRNGLVGWAFVRLFFAEIRWLGAALRAARTVRVRLPGGAAHEPFVRQGLRSALPWVVFSSLLSLFWIGGSAGSYNGLITAYALLVASVVFFVPLNGVRETVVAAKREEMARVDREIVAERETLLTGRAEAPGRMASLVAWRGLVADVREWPLTAPGVLRFALLALLGLGSWLGGALVERGLDRVLG